MENNNTALIDGLREFADFLETRPDLPFVTDPSPFNLFAATRDTLVAAVKVAGGKFEKNYGGEWFYMRRFFGPLRFDIYAAREQVCEARVIGKKIIPAIPERIVDDIEWTCGEVLR